MRAAFTGRNTGRGFSFVLSHADYVACREALDRVLWPYGFSEAAVDSAQQTLDRLARGEGLLTIRSMELGGLGKGSSPWFRSIRFDVALRLPRR